jgi:hypothetical protein
MWSLRTVIHYIWGSLSNCQTALGRDAFPGFTSLSACLFSVLDQSPISRRRSLK